MLNLYHLAKYLLGMRLVFSTFLYEFRLYCCLLTMQKYAIY